ncbi:MAG: phage holin family protein [Promicromonosporaceae bacterium]|nr:phage holin family protein [Promicromonosporaceae bacterium]
MSSRDDAPSLGQLVEQLSEQTSELVRAEVALAKKQFADKVKDSGIGIGLLCGAGVFAFYLTFVLILAAIWGLGNVVPLWASALIVAGVTLISIVALVIGGVALLKRASARPAATASMKESIATVRGSFLLKNRKSDDAAEGVASTGSADADSKEDQS